MLYETLSNSLWVVCILLESLTEHTAKKTNVTESQKTQPTCILHAWGEQKLLQFLRTLAQTRSPKLSKIQNSWSNVRVVEPIDLEEVAKDDVSLSPQPQRNAEIVGVHLIVVALGGCEGGEYEDVRVRV